MILNPVLKVSLALLCGLLLVACAGNPPPEPPPLRVAAENANRMAIAALRSERWESAESAWQEALTAYQAMDDWPGQGRARLGLAQTYARMGKNDKAMGVIQNIPQQDLFPKLLRARAAYQQALLLVSENPALAQQALDQARALCTEKCDLLAQFDNLAARLAAERGEWDRVQSLAARALDQAREQQGERAHAHRLLAEAALFAKQFALARSHLSSSIEVDRQLAEPEWLLEDYRLLERVARESADNHLEQEAKLRQAAICAVISPTKCP